MELTIWINREYILFIEVYMRTNYIPFQYPSNPTNNQPTSNLYLIFPNQANTNIHLPPPENASPNIRHKHSKSLFFYSQ